jgi:vitamin B12 transporter
MTSTPITKAAASRRLLLAAIGAAFSCAAQAQSEPVLAPVQVTSTRTPQQARDVLADNTVITAEQIAASGQTNLLDLLQNQRGIELSSNGGPGSVSSVFLRGAANNQTLVLIDGVRTASLTAGGASWWALPLSQIERIEIVYGPLSTLYGADAVGGVVQIFTKRGEGAPHFSLSAGAGRYDSRALEGGLSGGTGGDHPFHYAFNLARTQSDGFNATKPNNFLFNPDRDGYSRNSASGQLSLGLASGHEVGFSFLHSRTDAQFDGGLPFADDRTLTTVGSYALYSRDQLLPNWKSLLQLSRGTDRSDTTSAFPEFVAYSRQDSLLWQNDVSLGPDLLQVLLERRVEHVDTTASDFLPGLDLGRNTNALAASYQLRRGAHLASASIRNDDNSQYGNKTTGSLAYGYRLSQALRVNASYGTSFRAPNFGELYFAPFANPNLKPEEGKNLEAGIYYEQQATRVSAVAYRNRVSNLIVSSLATDFVPFNVNQAVLTGITFGASTRFGRYTLRGSLDVQDPHDAQTDKLLARRARRHGTLALEYGSGALHGGIETQFSGKRYDDAENTIRIGGYALLNLYGSYDLNRDWTVFARWNNALNKDYELAKDYATAKSNLFVGLRYGWR